MTKRDSTVRLSAPHGQGDSVDESAIVDVDGATLAKRQRVILGGEQSRESLVEPSPSDGTYALPVASVELRRLLELASLGNATIEPYRSSIPNR